MKRVSDCVQVATFLLELAVYASVITWAFHLNVHVAARAVIAAAAFACMAIAWGVCAAPRASKPLRGVPLATFEACWFGIGIAALYFSGRDRWAIALLLAVIVIGAVRVAA